MPAPSIRPAADPLDDIDRVSGGVDSLMARQDRADLPGERSDEPNAGDGDVYIEAERVVDGDPDIEDDQDADIDLARDRLAPAEAGLGADDDDTIDETERAGDDSIR